MKEKSSKSLEKVNDQRDDKTRPREGLFPSERARDGFRPEGKYGLIFSV